MLALIIIVSFIQGTLASCDARALIAVHEGKRKCVYKDTMGHPTIGIGYNLDNSGARQAITAIGANYDSIRSGKSCLTDAQIMELFEPSYKSAVSGARRAVSSYGSLCCNVQNVMTDMDYNLGDGGFSSFHGFISLINARSWNAAAADGAATAWCRQVGVRCIEDMAAVRKGCNGPSPPSPPSPAPPSPPSPPSPPTPTGCCSCVLGGGGKACAVRCVFKGAQCQTCIKNAGGKACGSRCGCGAEPSQAEFTV